MEGFLRLRFFFGGGGEGVGGFFRKGLFLFIFFFFGGGGYYRNLTVFLERGISSIAYPSKNGVDIWRPDAHKTYSSTPTPQPPSPRNKSAASDHSLSVWYASQGILPCLVPLFETQFSNSVTIHRVRNEENHKQDRDFDTPA